MGRREGCARRGRLVRCPHAMPRDPQDDYARRREGFPKENEGWHVFFFRSHTGVSAFPVRSLDR